MALGCRKQRGSIGVRTWFDWRRVVGWADRVGRTALQTASGPRLVGSADVNGVGMLATAWDECRSDVGRLVLGRRSG